MAQGYIKTINYKSFWKLCSFLAEFLSCHLHLKNVSLNLILHAKIVSFFKMTRKFTSMVDHIEKIYNLSKLETSIL